MKIIVDENIPHVEKYFEAYGDVIKLPGRSIKAADVADADALIVRSVTEVNAALLAASSVKFVGTCTIGVDHLDQHYLQDNNIDFASAPGCNANSVAEYVCSALAVVRPNWLSAKVGIIGMGNVGSRVSQRLLDLGLDVVAYDPLITPSKYPNLTTLEQVLNCDIIAMHAPLTIDGSYPSRHMVGASELLVLKSGALLLNCGRGACIDNQALLNHMKTNPNKIDVVLDVWEDEPSPELELLPYVAIATPHIAGYSHDGKLSGTAMILQQFCRSFELDSSLARKNLDQHFDADFSEIKTLSPGAVRRQNFLNEVILQSYDVRIDDAVFRDNAKKNSNAFAQSFDQMRKQYPQRLEFFHYKIEVKTEFESEKEKQLLDRNLAALGYSQ